MIDLQPWLDALRTILMSLTLSMKSVFGESIKSIPMGRILCSRKVWTSAEPKYPELPVTNIGDTSFNWSMISLKDSSLIILWMVDRVTSCLALSNRISSSMPPMIKYLTGVSGLNTLMESHALISLLRLITQITLLRYQWKISKTMRVKSAKVGFSPLIAENTIKLIKQATMSSASVFKCSKLTATCTIWKVRKRDIIK